MTPLPPGPPGQWPSTDPDQRRTDVSEGQVRSVRPGTAQDDRGDDPVVGAGAPARPARHPIGTVVVLGTGVAVLFVVLVVVYLAVTGGSEQSSNTGSGFPVAATSAPQVPPTSGVPEPSVPEPTDQLGIDESKKVLKLGDHPLLSDPEVGLRTLACHLPPWTSDPAAATAFFTAATDCLNAAWEPVLSRYELPFAPPRLVFPTGDAFQSQCGTIEVGIGTAAYYCEGDLFLPYRGLQTDQYGDNPGVYLALIAHEYGHHVQEMAGIMDAAWEQIYAAGEHTAAGAELSRRKELQAQCFSGMFLGSHVDRGGSISRIMYDEAWEDQETRGDDTSGGSDHGNNENYAGWWRTGAVDNRIIDCNTFTAAPAEVR